LGKEFCFLFYPGEYLRDTQVLSEAAQVAYDRIMCEHMRNICITQQQLNFITKRLSPEQKDEIMYLMRETNGGFQIEWVAESIEKRRNYTESRAKNREGKTKNISKTYDNHMVKEKVIVNKDKVKEKKEIIYPFDSENFKNAWKLWKEFKKEQFNFTYKTIGEQGALVDLAKLSGGNESHAIKLIHHAIGKNWKGIYQINENGQTTKTGEITIDELRKEVARQSGS
jgi:hypothetical protein